jgi:predicted enzyme related to lactoylglutathione lyase
MMTDVFQTHGRFSWTELMTSDVAAARAFYGDVL